MKTAVVFVLGVIVGLGTLAVLRGGGGAPLPSPLPTPSPTPTTSPLPPAMCEALVKLSVRAGAIVADPENVCLAVGRPMTWEIVDRGTVTIDFETFDTKKGPFPEDTTLLNHDHTMINKERGTYVAKNTAATASTMKVKVLPAEDEPRRWKYTINWTLPDGTPLPKFDPVVCIRR